MGLKAEVYHISCYRPVQFLIILRRLHLMKAMENIKLGQDNIPRLVDRVNHHQSAKISLKLSVMVARIAL